MKAKIIRKNILLLIITIILLQFSYTCILASPSTMTLIFSHDQPPNHPYQLGFEKMAAIIEEKTNGEIKCDIFHSATLGEEADIIVALRDGTIDITTISAAPVSTFVKEFIACDFPFMFSSSQEAFDFYDGEIGNILFEKTEDIGLVGLCWWENGFFNLINNIRPIITQEDLVGLKIRTMSSLVHMATMRALGSSPVPIAFGEVYTSLQQGVVDGSQHPLAITYGNRFYEVQKYLTISNTFHDPSPTFISKKTWDKLSEEQREIVKEASIIGRDYERQLIVDNESDIIEALKKEGMEVVVLTPEQLNVFRKATKDVWGEFDDKIGKEFLDKFLNALP